MKTITLYHGSNRIVGAPVYGQGRTDNDYGRGFYCTKEWEIAAEWAAYTSLGGFVNTYELDEEGLCVLHLTEGTYHILHWMALLLNYRRVRLSSPVEERGVAYLKENYLPDIDGYDVIVGYRADDSYFSYARAFVSNTITVGQLSQAMNLGGLGMQYVLKSHKAFQRLRVVGAEPIDGAVYFAKRNRRDLTARAEYRRLLEKADVEGLYLSDLMRGGVSDAKSIRG